MKYKHGRSMKDPYIWQSKQKDLCIAKDNHRIQRQDIHRKNGYAMQMTNMKLVSRICQGTLVKFKTRQPNRK